MSLRSQNASQVNTTLSGQIPDGILLGQSLMECFLVCYVLIQLDNKKCRLCGLDRLTMLLEIVNLKAMF